MGCFSFQTWLLLGLAIFQYGVVDIDAVDYIYDYKHIKDAAKIQKPNTKHVRLRQLHSKNTKRELVPSGPPKISNRAFGEKELLVIRVEGKDGSSTTESREKLIENIFTDEISVSNQFAACSNNQFLIRPAEGSPNIDNGVITVEVDKVTGVDAAVIYQEIETLSLSTNHFGRPLEDFDHVAICMPPGVTTLRLEEEQQENRKWIAFVPTESPYTTYMSIYNDEWCSSVSAMMHEIGHNLGLQHSGEAQSESNSNAYDDETGQMGVSYRSKTASHKCFNPAKSWQLGWYARQSLRLDPFLDETPVSMVLMGITREIYTKKSYNKYFLLQIDNGPDGDLYIGYNRRDSFNDDTEEGQDMLLVNLQGVGSFRSSQLLAKLDVKDSFRIENYRGIVGKTLVISMKDRVGEGAMVDIYFDYPSDGCSNGENTVRFEVSVVTDEYPEDTSWTLTNDNTGEIVARRSQGSFFEPMIAEIDWVCLDRDGSSYTFEMFDSHQDGLCCDFGFGGYTGFLGGKEIFRGSEFENMPSVTHSFVVLPLPNGGSSIDIDPPEVRGICEDDPTYLFNNKKRRNCGWVGRNKSRQQQKCRRNDPKTTRSVSYHCPSVCLESCQNKRKR